MPTTSPLPRALELAQAAGEELLAREGHLHRADARRKGLSRDLVSEADLAAERVILAGIPAGDRVLAEESGGPDDVDAPGRLWIVDPLDGTVNYLHGLPFWAVSIGVFEGGVPTAAVVHSPRLGLTFTAARGEGAWLSGQRLEVSHTDQIGEALLATGFSYNRNVHPDNNMQSFQRLALAAADVRRLGSAALDLAFVAAGRLDGFWELHLGPWDVAAGLLLIREAGGRVSDYHGREDSRSVLFSRHVIASNGRVHDGIAAQLEPLVELA
jgi:myo-inositol-1(or 4)-monophosphatase